MPVLQIPLLGDFHLAFDGQTVTGVNASRLQALLAYLLLHRDIPQMRQHLAFLFWPDTTESRAYTNHRAIEFAQAIQECHQPAITVAEGR